MRYEKALVLLTNFAFSLATPVSFPSLDVREVPQEHSHNIFLSSVRASLAKKNPASIKDPVFGLLGNAAAAAGQGSITDTDCLHQATADQAFTNAKAAGDVSGMTDALVYAALERNTGKVGLASVKCTAIKAKNPEIGTVSQHQDPASPNAAAINKAVTLELARQIASIGGDPQQAAKAGTFSPGDIGDPTAKGNSCDTADDEQGCIFTQKLLAPDATPEEITAAAGSSRSNTSSTATQAAAKAGNAPLQNSTTVANSTTMTAPNANVTSPASAATATNASVSSKSPSAGNNVQSFTGALGGLPPPVIKSSGGRPFSVKGDTFVNSGAALQRSCSIQHNACADAANSGKLAGGVGQCDTQETECNDAAGK
ncbi:MAG: hypothetical protein Q9191_003600 [Dirinaria sp. TL-2023a]